MLFTVLGVFKFVPRWKIKSFFLFAPLLIALVYFLRQSADIEHALERGSFFRLENLSQLRNYSLDNTWVLVFPKPEWQHDTLLKFSSGLSFLCFSSNELHFIYGLIEMMQGLGKSLLLALFLD